MKLFYVLLFISLLTPVAFGQKPDDILATAKGHTIRLRDLSPELQKEVAEFPAHLLKARRSLFDQMINERLLGLEARSLGVASGKIIVKETAKIPAPTEIEIKAVYKNKQMVLGGRPLSEVRKPIIDYLRGQAEQKMLADLSKRLLIKYKFSAGKDVNAAGLAPGDVVATVNGQPVTAKEFEEYALIPLFDVKAHLSDDILNEIDNALYVALLADEATSLGIDAGTLIGREITDKLKEFTDEERFALTDDLAKRLFSKYQVKILYTAPEPIQQNISVGNSPATGPANAPVTIVMFSDFQCSACSAAHPILKKVMETYPEKIRFVVRHFPLEAIHADAWRAALAAAAANAQGKFFQFIEILYTNQDKLDDASLKKYAADLGLNVKQFELDFNSEKTAAFVKKDIADGESYGVRGTPTIYVNGLKIRHLSTRSFKTAIDKALENK